MAASESSYVCSLSPELLKKAEDELFETPDRRERELRKLRDLIKQHGALHCRTDDAYLLRFLRARKFDSDRALEVIINYFTLRAQNADILGPVLPSAATTILESGMSMILPGKDKEGRAIAYFRPGKWDVEKFTMRETLKLQLMNLEQMVLPEDNQVTGMVAIGDFSNFGMHHVMRFDRSFAKLSSSLIQEAFPLRLKAIHYVNEPTIFGYIFALFKPLMKAKLASRLHFHGSNRESLYQVIDKSSLPEDLGGDLPSGDELGKNWRKHLESQEDFYKDMLQYHIELPSDVDAVPKDVGVVGTAFRKLDID